MKRHIMGCPVSHLPDLPGARLGRDVDSRLRCEAQIPDCHRAATRACCAEVWP